MEATRFFLLKFFYCNTWKQLKFVGVTFDCVIFMFYNTYIFFFELFMCKVLGLRFFYYKLMIFLLIFFGLGPKLETDQSF